MVFALGRPMTPTTCYNRDYGRHAEIGDNGYNEFLLNLICLPQQHGMVFSHGHTLGPSHLPHGSVDRLRQQLTLAS